MGQVPPAGAGPKCRCVSAQGTPALRRAVSSSWRILVSLVSHTSPMGRQCPVLPLALPVLTPSMAALLDVIHGNDGFLIPAKNMGALAHFLLL